MNYARVEYESEINYGTGFPVETTGLATSVFFPQVFSLNGKESIIIPSAQEVREKETGLVPEYSGGYFKLIEVVNVNTNTNLGTVTTLAEQGIYIATYRGTVGGETASGYPTAYVNLIYTFSVVINRLPLKKWTVLDVINRAFDLIEPLRDFDLIDGEKPKFRLTGQQYDGLGKPSGVVSGSTADRLKDIISPEFAFTQMNLREAK